MVCSRLFSHRAASFILVAGAMCFAAPSYAQEFFESARPFVIDKACDATSAIKTPANPTPLTVGTSYPGRGLNRKTASTHAFIRVDQQSKWVALECGHFADKGITNDTASAAPSPASMPNTQGPGNQVCLPFFDHDNQTHTVRFGGDVDVTPVPPTLNAFDVALTNACGPAGKVVPKAEFIALMKANQDVLARIKTFTSGKVFANKPSLTNPDDYLADLAEAWFALNAFDHIMCGEPRARAKIGGLHFAGRYLQLQQSGEACRMDNYKQYEVVPGAVYTFGVRMKNAQGSFVPDATKGYGLTMNGEDILKAATRAFSENPIAGDQSRGCTVQVTDDGQKMSVVFVRRESGIRTMYPDATPNGPGDKLNAPCAAPIDLGR